MSDSKEVATISTENYVDVLAEIEEAYWSIPFENSGFQTENFVIAASITPERAYRSIGLRMHSKLRALAETQHSLAKEDIDIEELEAKIADPNTNDFDRRRAQLDIDFKRGQRRFTQKLANDAVAELNLLYAYFKKMPKYTREQFEAGEQQHFQERLNRQIHNVQGAQESLVNMNLDIKNIDHFLEQFALTGDSVYMLDKPTQ